MCALVCPASVGMYVEKRIVAYVASMFGFSARSPLMFGSTELAPSAGLGEIIAAPRYTSTFETADAVIEPVSTPVSEMPNTASASTRNTGASLMIFR
jgi:hypothetical protein